MSPTSDKPNIKNIINFFNDKILLKDRNPHLLPSAGNDLYLKMRTLETAITPETYLDCFPLNNIEQLISLMSSYRPATFVTDHLPTQLL